MVTSISLSPFITEHGAVSAIIKVHVCTNSASVVAGDTYVTLTQGSYQNALIISS